TESRVMREIVRLSDPMLKTLCERGIECIFVGYAEHSKAFKFFVIEPNQSVSINSIIESKDAIFDENRFSSVPRPSLRIPNGTEDIGGSVVPEEVTEEGVQQPEPELIKSKRNRTPKNFGPEFQLCVQAFCIFSHAIVIPIYRGNTQNLLNGIYERLMTN
ncbi:hypothetical protein Tco_1248795, partial [Tanacetum coccineum]